MMAVYALKSLISCKKIDIVFIVADELWRGIG